MRLLGLGTYDVGAHPRVGVILAGLARRGHVVRELNEPLGIGTAGRVEALRNPRAAAKFAVGLARKWGRIAVRSRIYRGAHGPDAVLVGYLGHFDVLLARSLYPRTLVVLDHLVFASDTAADRRLTEGIAGKAKRRLLRGLDRAALAAADVVVLDTREHLAMLPERHRRKGIVVPVGAPRTWLEAGASRRAESGGDAPLDAARENRLRVVFFGLFTPLQGTPVVAEALAECDRRGVPLDVTLIGDGQDAGKVRDLLPRGGDVRVTWIDWVDSAELPGLVAGHDVCLGIFGTSDKAQRVVPNKAYQGLAAGCALVTSDTPPQRAALGQAPVYVPAGDPAALADALARLADPAALADARARAALVAERFAPEAVVAEIAEALR